MAIQINPVDFRGFALGGVGTPQLPQVGALGLQAAQSVMSQQSAAADRAAQERMNMARIRSSDEAMLRQNIMERNKLGQQNDQFNKSLGLDKNKLALLKSQNLAENAMKAEQMGKEYDLSSQKIDLAKVEQEYNKWKSTQENARENLKLEMIQLKEKKTEEIQTMGAFATTARLSMDKVKDPADARTLQLSILDDAVKSKYITADQAKQMRSMPVSSFKNALDFKIMQLDKVAEYKAMNDIQNPKEKGKSSGGGMEIIAPDGTVVKMQGLNTPVQGKLQQDVLDKEKGLSQFEEIEKGYDPDYFTYRNQKGAGAASVAQKSKGIPLIEQGAEALAGVLTGKTKEERAEFLSKRKAYMNGVEQMFNTYKKEITGAAAGEKEIEQIRNSFINGDLSPSEFKGALEQIVDRYKSESTQAKKALGSGLDIGTSQPTIRKYNPSTGRLE